MKVPSQPTAARSTCLKVFQQGVWLHLPSSTLLSQSPVACVFLHFIVFRASPLSAVYMSQVTNAGVTEIRIWPFVCLSTYFPWNKFVVVYSGMFRTQVQIWFQLEFPCNVPNLIKLMRAFFPAISMGFPVSVPTSSAQLCTREARASVRNRRSRSIPATPFAAGTEWGCQGRHASGNW